MNGRICKLIERRESVINQIREMEMERIQHDTLNVNRCKPLYDILYNLNNEIVEEMIKDGMQKEN